MSLFMREEKPYFSSLVAWICMALGMRRAVFSLVMLHIVCTGMVSYMQVWRRMLLSRCVHDNYPVAMCTVHTRIVMCTLHTQIAMCTVHTRIVMCTLHTQIAMCTVHTRIVMCTVHTRMAMCTVHTRIVMCTIHTRIAMCTYIHVELYVAMYT